MRKTNLLGATFLALATASLPLTTFAQAPAASPAAPAPMAAPTPAPAPSPAPADVTPSAPAPDTSASSSAPAEKPMKKPMHKKMMAHKGGKLVATKAGDKAVDDLNAESLDSAKTGKPFTPSATPPAAKETAHAGMGHKMAHHAKKTKTTTTTPSGDSATTTTTTTPNADAPK